MTNWEENKMQFPRLIAELQMAGAFTPVVMEDLQASMDLSEMEVQEIIERAVLAFDRLIEELELNGPDNNDKLDRLDEYEGEDYNQQIGGD